MALILGIGFLWVLRLTAWPLALLIGGVALGAGLAPLVRWVDHWLPRTAAVAVVYIFLLLIFLALLWSVVPTIITQGQEAIDQLPEFLNTLDRRLGDWLPMQEGDVSVGEMVMGFFTGGAGTSALISLPQRVLTWTAAFLVVIFVSIYALIYTPNAREFLLSLFPEGATRARVDEVAHNITEAMGGWVRGTIIDGLIVGVLTYIGLIILDYPFAIVIAVLAGLLEFIPVVGPLVTGIIIVAVGLVQSTTQALFGLAFAVILQQIESNILVPIVMRGQAHVSPLLTLIALLAGERIGGLVGALVAIPLVAGLRIFVLEVVAPAIRTWTEAPPVEEEEEEEEE